MARFDVVGMKDGVTVVNEKEKEPGIAAMFALDAMTLHGATSISITPTKPEGMGVEAPDGPPKVLSPA